MKVGVNAWLFDVGVPAGDILRMAKDAGYDGVEFNLAAKGPVTTDMPDDALRAISIEADRLGLELPSLCTPLYWQYSFTSDYPERRASTMSLLKRQIDAAVLLGAKHVLCVAGTVGVDLDLDSMFSDLADLPFDTRDETIDYEKAYIRAMAAMREASSYAADRRVKICVENVGAKFLLSPLEMRSFIDEVNSPWVGVYFDVGNVYRIGYPDHWIRALGSRISMVHGKNYSKKKGCFVQQLSDGDADYEAVIHALRSINYDGWIIAEHMGPGEHATSDVLYGSAVYLRQMTR